MKKRTISFLLVLTMIFSMASSMVMASENDVCFDRVASICDNFDEIVFVDIEYDLTHRIYDDTMTPEMIADFEMFISSNKNSVELQRYKLSDEIIIADIEMSVSSDQVTVNSEPDYHPKGQATGKGVVACKQHWVNGTRNCVIDVFDEYYCANTFHTNCRVLIYKGTTTAQIH